MVATVDAADEEQPIDAAGLHQRLECGEAREGRHARMWMATPGNHFAVGLRYGTCTVVYQM